MPKPGAESRRLTTLGTVIPFPKEQRPSEPDNHTPQTCDLASALIVLVERCHHVAPDLCIRLCAAPGAAIEIAAYEAATLDFVIREIASNAYRYSHPAGTPVEVTIECGINRNGEIVIDIGDDGVGLPPDFAEWRDAGDGMVSVRYRLQQIGADLHVTSDDLGLRFQIILHPQRRRATPARGNFVWL